MKKTVMAVVMGLVGMAMAETVVNVTGTGASKTPVEIKVENQDYARCLKKNLELSGLFAVSASGAIKVTGQSGAVTVVGMGKSMTSGETFSDAKSARMAARRLSDAMCQAFGNQKGFALDRVVFLNRGAFRGKGTTVPSEICLTYPDGMDIRSLTGDQKMTIYPRWKNSDTIYYISDMRGAPQIWEMNVDTGVRKMKWSFKGSPDGVAVSPDGSKAAAILSIQGNPELYIINGSSLTRLTNTPLASEGQPTWSPDGRKIAYVSNETRHPQIYVVDIATRKSRRLTSRGRENVDPDWGPDGRIVYITKRGGAQVAVMDPAVGDTSAQLVTKEATWEHPSWSRDCRHVTANRDKALFVIDTKANDNGEFDAPVQMFSANGNWMSPCWRR